MNQKPVRDRPSKHGLLSDYRFRVALYSILIAASGYIGIVVWGGWKDINNSIRSVGLGGVTIILSLSLMNFSIRFFRWTRYLVAVDYAMPFWPSLKIYVAGFAMTMTPGKVGEVLRGVLLKNWGMPYSKSLATLFSERLSDLLAVVLLMLIGTMASEVTKEPFVAGAIGLSVGFLIISNQKMIEKMHLATGGKSGRIILVHHFLSILLESRRCHTPFLLTAATALSLAAWTIQAFTFHLILTWLALGVPISFSVFVFSISLLAGALSLMPGGLGGVEASMTALLMWKGVGATEAIAATVLFRLATLWFAVVLGMISLALEIKSNEALRQSGLDT